MKRDKNLRIEWKKQCVVLGKIVKIQFIYNNVFPKSLDFFVDVNVNN